MREPKPFFRKQTRTWYVQIGKKQHNLGPDEQSKSITLSWRGVNPSRTRPPCTQFSSSSWAGIRSTGRGLVSFGSSGMTGLHEVACRRKAGSHVSLAMHRGR